MVPTEFLEYPFFDGVGMLEIQKMQFKVVLFPDSRFVALKLFESLKHFPGMSVSWIEM